MKLWFAWVGYKRDGRNKVHLWGVLNQEEGRQTNKFIFWGPANGPIYKRPVEKLEYIFHKKDQKIKDGYRITDQPTVEAKWPNVLDELEMQFMMEKLSHA